MELTCNCCNSTVWREIGVRGKMQCAECWSFERTRITKFILDHYGLPKPGTRVLHLAPDRGLVKTFTDVSSVIYEPVDFDPDNYKFCDAGKIDLCTDAENLPSNHYDIILHSHVVEHIPCNISAVLFHLHRALTTEGFHIMCIPFIGGHSGEDLAPLAPDEAAERFGQHDHVRKFGRNDIESNLGMLFDFGDGIDLTKLTTKSKLRNANIPDDMWKGISPSSVFVFRKDDIKLKA